MKVNLNFEYFSLAWNEIQIVIDNIYFFGIHDSNAAAQMNVILLFLFRIHILWLFSQSILRRC